ncbi:hypothetical protein A8B75_00995 [Sphingomonadales bacterium EhC05]|nr:hypothetical protein A8B75_00995 [Sphingomonadales bacterium EhC05]
MNDRFSVSLGQGIEGPVSLSKEARDVHTHVIGLSRQGKSYFLEHLIRQDIEQGAGVCVIDPHGELYGHMVAWCAANDMHRRRRIHLINPAAGKWSVGFNPLAHDDAFVDARVGAMIEACQKVWEDTESTGHKTLAKLLKMVFTTLAYHQLSVQEAALLTSLQYVDTRKRLVEATGDQALIDSWGELDGLKTQDFVQRFEAVNNRLFDLTRNPGVSSMMAQTEDVIDFKTCMDRGDIILVNLAHRGRIPPSVSQTVGALITADLFHSAQCRDIEKAKQRPFYCYIDECGDYLNETIVKGLDQTAKFGLHYVLSHQRLSQLGARRDDPIRNGVMGGAQSKIVFLQDDADTTSEVGDLLFGKDYDLERPKEVLIKPTVIGYSREWLEAEGAAVGTFSGSSSGFMSGEGLGLSLAQVQGAAAVDFSSESSGQSESYSSGNSSIRSNSRHEALIPILEDMPGGVYSLDEEKHKGMIQIRLLKKRQAFAYRADDRKAHQFVTADLLPAAPTFEQLDDFYAVIEAREKSAKPVAEVELAAAKRREQLLIGRKDKDLGTDDFFG